MLARSGTLLIFHACCFRVGALGNESGRLQNGTASTGKPDYFSVLPGKGSNDLVAHPPLRKKNHKPQRTQRYTKETLPPCTFCVPCGLCDACWSKPPTTWCVWIPDFASSIYTVVIRSRRVWP